MKNLIAVKIDCAISVFSSFLKVWDNGGEERSKTAISVEAQSRVLSEAPTHTGLFWWRRETTPTERKIWAEREWLDKSWESEAKFAQIWERTRNNRRRDLVNEIRSLLSALQADRQCLTAAYILPDLWDFAHKRF